MKAMILEEPRRIERRDAERPERTDGEVLVKVGFSGICGTDEKIYGGFMPARYPLVMGHEITGAIAEGEGWDGSGPGTRVIVDPTVFCGDCFHCRIGQTNLCPNGQLLGRERDGGFAEYVTVPKENVFLLPDEVNDKEAAFIQVFSTCVHVQQLAPISPGESVVVLGLGVTGQLHVQLAKAAGAEPVIGITRSAWKRELAEEFGADLTLAPDADTKKRVLEATEGRGADMVIETAGRVSVLAQCIDLVRVGGRVVPFGIYTETEGKLPFYDLYYKELRIIAGRASKGESFPASIDLVRKGVVRLEPLITHVLPLDELDRAINMLSTQEEGRMKMILEN